MSISVSFLTETLKYHIFVSITEQKGQKPQLFVYLLQNTYLVSRQQQIKVSTGADLSGVGFGIGHRKQKRQETEQGSLLKYAEYPAVGKNRGKHNIERTVGCSKTPKEKNPSTLCTTSMLSGTSPPLPFPPSPFYLCLLVQKDPPAIAADHGVEGAPELLLLQPELQGVVAQGARHWGCNYYKQMCTRWLKQTLMLLYTKLLRPNPSQLNDPLPSRPEVWYSKQSRHVFARHVHFLCI